jgi:hypothetical protein
MRFGADPIRYDHILEMPRDGQGRNAHSNYHGSAVLCPLLEVKLPRRWGARVGCL